MSVSIKAILVGVGALALLGVGYYMAQEETTTPELSSAELSPAGVPAKSVVNVPMPAGIDKSSDKLQPLSGTMPGNPKPYVANASAQTSSLPAMVREMIESQSRAVDQGTGYTADSTRQEAARAATKAYRDSQSEARER